MPQNARVTFHFSDEAPRVARRHGVFAARKMDLKHLGHLHAALVPDGVVCKREARERIIRAKALHEALASRRLDVVVRDIQLAELVALPRWRSEGRKAVSAQTSKMRANADAPLLPMWCRLRSRASTVPQAMHASISGMQARSVNRALKRAFEFPGRITRVKKVLKNNGGREKWQIVVCGGNRPTPDTIIQRLCKNDARNNRNFCTFLFVLL